MAKYSTRSPIVFNPSAATVNFSGFTNFDVRSLYAIVDLTAGVPIYLTGISNFGYSALSLDGHTITLQASMAGLAPTDVLAVTYDDGNDSAADLLALFAGQANLAQQSPVLSVTGNPYAGAQMRAPAMEDLLRLCFAAIRVMTRLSIVDKQVSDGDVDSMLNDELTNSPWL